MAEDWKQELDEVVELMRHISSETDPQRAVEYYASRARKLFGIDAFCSVSRRGLEKPFYRITRSSIWPESIDPWLNADKLPILSTGLLGELCYLDKPMVIKDIAGRLHAGDPTAVFFRDEIADNAAAI